MLIMLFFSFFCSNELWEPMALSSPQPLPALTPLTGEFPGNFSASPLPFDHRASFQTNTLGVFFVCLLVVVVVVVFP